MIKFHFKYVQCGIYSISIDNKIVYIGQSRDLWGRATSHKSNILNSEEVWYPLAREFYKRGHLISIELLEKVTEKQLRDKEKTYI